MSALSQDSYLNSGYPLFYVNNEGEAPDPGPEPPPPPPDVPDPPPIPEPPTNTPGNFGIGGSLIVGAFNQNIEAGGLGQLQVVSVVDNSNNLWNEIIGTQTHAGAVARAADTSLWLAGTRDGVGGIEVASGISTTANTYSTQVNVYADMLVAGSIRCARLIPGDPGGSVSINAAATGLQIVNVAFCPNASCQIDLLPLKNAGVSLANLNLGTLTASSGNAGQGQVEFLFSTFPPDNNGQAYIGSVRTYTVCRLDITVNQNSPATVYNLTVPIPINIRSSPKLYIYVSSSTSSITWGFTISNTTLTGFI